MTRAAAQPVAAREGGVRRGRGGGGGSGGGRVFRMRRVALAGPVRMRRVALAGPFRMRRVALAGSTPARRLRKPARVIALALSAAFATFALAACAGAAGGDPAATATGANESASASGPPSNYGEEPTETPVLPTSDAASLDDARVRGGDALGLYLRPDADPDAWLAELRPYLAPEAVDVVTIAGPAALPTVTVDAAGARVSDGATVFTAIVVVPTSGGEWSVSMRRDAGGEWLVSAFQPPVTAGAAGAAGAAVETPDAGGAS